VLFRRIVMYALLVGVVSGLALTAVQFWQVIPIIQSAERFEESAPPAAHEHDAHDHGGHEHAAGAWAPADGLERTGFTLLSNVLTAVGFALVLLAAMSASRRVTRSTSLDWRHGLAWGAAGYAVFFAVPALGLPPEVPGAAAAALEARQFWWVLAVVCTAAALAGAAFGKSPWRWAALLLLALPFVIGAPQPDTAPFAGHAPAAAAELEQLAQRFVGATAIANAVLWIVLGLGSAWAINRIVSPAASEFAVPSARPNS